MSVPGEPTSVCEDVEDRTKTSSEELISGVVEGFYGKPWTLQQRKHLFTRLRQLGMNTYFYAPKDDVKHRGEWRLAYTTEEIEVLQDLINCANENEIDFVYALSPGLDIQYSLQKDVEQIKEKLHQVKVLGCKSFALLFDDIETEMQETDKQKFASFATAQVAVANEVYRFLECPHRFFFCPTEYCETRAQPTLRESEYLNTVGDKLMSQIHVMWTGAQVIAKTFPIEHVQSVSEVLQRKPVIWDNLHANDYDPKRLFMGPFAGRQVALKETISGLLLNPNCKYESNFVPLQTLSDWFQAEQDAANLDDPNALLEVGGLSPLAHVTVQAAKPTKVYHPLSSLRDALQLWSKEFERCVAHFFPALEISETIAKLVEAEMASPPDLSEIVQSAVIAMDTSPANANYLASETTEPMDVVVPQTAKATSSEESSDTTTTDEPMESCERPEKIVNAEMLSLLVDMFFLPFDSGRRANEMLDQFSWLYENARFLSRKPSFRPESPAPLTDEWIQRHETLRGYVANSKQIFRAISECPNKSLVAELIPYIWEAHGVCAVLSAVAEWLKLATLLYKPEEQPRFWTTDVDEEPWLGNGGFLNNVYKALAGGGDLYNLCLFKCFLPLSIVDFSILPLTNETITKLSALASMESDRTPEQNDLNRNLFIDKYIRLFMEHDPNYVFITEDDSNKDNQMVISSAVAVLNAKMLVDHLPEYVRQLKEKYSSVLIEGVNHPAIVSEIGNWFPKIPDFVTDAFPSWLDVRFSADAYDAVPTRRMILAVCIALSMNGSKGVFVSVPVTEADKIQFFMNIGFVEIARTDDYTFVILARSISRSPVDVPCPDSVEEASS